MLYIDCGHTASGTQYTGIQRYVRHTLRQAHALLGPGRVGGVCAGLQGWSSLPVLAAHPLEGLPDLALAAGEPCFDEQSHVVLADRFWHTGAWDALDTLIASRARISVVVYDLLSLRQPAWFPAGVGERFENYLSRVLPRADRIVCLSAAVRTDLAEWMRARGIHCAQAVVIRPGHQVWNGEPQPPACLPAEWRTGRTPFVLQVGSLEPRKNHALTLAALQRQWDNGRDIGCLFVGQRGWLMEPFMESMAKLPQWQRQLLWLSECTDAQLDWCYRHAAAVMYPSADEGYGLPLAEAAAAGAAVVASDTAIHREVAGLLPAGAPIRLSEPEAGALSQALHEILGRAPARPAARPRCRDWRAATRDLLALPTPARETARRGSDGVCHAVLDRADQGGLVFG